VLGVFGLGRIGRVVAERGLGLHMHVIAHDPFVDPAGAPVGVRLVTFDELVAQSDFLTIHAPRTKETENILDAAAIAKMKKGARIINAARGGIVNEDALCDALESGHLGGAALDVFTTEPLPEDHRLRGAPNLVLTPHLGASTREAKRSVSLDMANQIVLCLEKGVALNGINVPRITRAQAQYVGPFLDLTRNLASFLSQVFPGRIRSLRLTLQGEIPASAAHPLTAVMLVGALHSRAEGPVTPVNAERIAEQLGVRVHTESSSVKRDFVNVVRVEALVDDERHIISGTVLGSRHGRMVELDDFLLDAIPEGPMLVTFHENVPGVVGRIGQVLADEHVNISRLQLGATGAAGNAAMGIWNLDAPVSDSALERLRNEAKITRVCGVT
jgi:D-3-phosphoglycerate dehydrogenase